MGRSPCCSKELGLNRGAWTKQEDMILSEYIRIHGVGEWRNLPQKAGIKRRGKSCRLRWVNYLRPDIKRGSISGEEEELIIRMHRLLGNRWSLIAGRLPGRTDNEIKNYWNTHLSKKLQSTSHSDQPNSSAQNLISRSKSPSLLQNHVFKTPPGLKITTTVKQVEMASPKGCSNSSRDEAFKFCNVKETTDDDSEHIPFAVADVSLVETEVKSSTCSMSDQQSSHSDHFAGDAATLTENSLYLNELSSPHWNLLFSPSDCSIDFGLEEFYRGLATMATETIEFQDLYSSDQSNMQSINSFTASDCQQMEEFHDNAQHKDWIGELNYL